MLYSCSSSGSTSAIAVFIAVPPGANVRAYRPTGSDPPPVLNMAHGPSLKSVPKPTCWNASAVNVAAKSSKRFES